MDPTDRQDGPASSTGDRPNAPRPETDAQALARTDRRAEALRANLKRRKAQSRGRADAERADPAG
ncbi:hypothetical protein D3273_16240 [Lichenibacterium minor]|uniref:Uncharacterized protein n=1 Tax=Lichenibacterium minor TaxID=2316528 RepID=A0A4Q2U541_9HYPH|nr:hypothetical protein [Lichenibacterium minor]RYC30918.1 hypothetical protein D3273_16240 [Lichenibacterium minor]